MMGHSRLGHPDRRPLSYLHPMPADAAYRDPLEVLRTHWGYDAFRPLQEDIIRSVLDGRDTLALLPTGGGKSVCFQVPALARDGICLVISPLIALMIDQVHQLHTRDIPAAAIHSGMKRRDIDRILDNAVHGGYRFLYLSPERLQTDLARARIERMNVNLIAVDEAHCISQWGYDFRPPYLRIAELREILPGVPFLAVTATATPRVARDIQENLGFETPHLLQASFDRPNLAYVVRHVEAKLRKLVEILHRVPGTSVVYVRNRRRTAEVAHHLRHTGISAEHYHAGLSAAERTRRQEDWIAGRTRVIVATNAFGMGIDKPNVRTVVHLDLPDTIEAYFQEAGRAGRDGQTAYAALLFNASDTVAAERKIAETMPTIQEVKRVYHALGSFFQLPVGQGQFHAFAFDTKAFCQRFDLHPVRVLHALRFLAADGYLTLTESVASPSSVHIRMDRSALYTFQVENPRHDPLVKYMLRTYGGILDGFARVDETRMARHFQTGRERIVDLLNELEDLDVLSYDRASDSPRIEFLTPRLPMDNLLLDQAHIEDRKKVFETKLRDMLDYATSTVGCRSQFLLAYFGEADAPPCGRCDLCLDPTPSGRDLAGWLAGQLADDPRSPEDLVADRPDDTTEDELLAEIARQVDRGRLTYDDQDRLTWTG